VGQLVTVAGDMQTVAVLGGDGVRPEITQSALAVLVALRPDLNYQMGLVGAAALQKGLPALPDDTRALCDQSAAILFGSVGGHVQSSPALDRPERALLLLRRDYKLFANLRPVRVFPGLEHASSLKPELVRGLDLMIVRELTGGIYYGQPKGQHTVDGIQGAVDTMRYLAPEIERSGIFRFSS
jgi:3-isopropylmalate dehydrogenase